MFCYYHSTSSVFYARPSCVIVILIIYWMLIIYYIFQHGGTWAGCRACNGGRRSFWLGLIRLGYQQTDVAQILKTVAQVYTDSALNFGAVKNIFHIMGEAGEMYVNRTLPRPSRRFGLYLAHAPVTRSRLSHRWTSVSPRSCSLGARRRGRFAARPSTWRRKWCWTRVTTGPWTFGPWEYWSTSYWSERKWRARTSPTTGRSIWSNRRSGTT